MQEVFMQTLDNNTLINEKSNKRVSLEDYHNLEISEIIVFYRKVGNIGHLHRGFKPA
jgi:hypothetical protein